MKTKKEKIVVACFFLVFALTSQPLLVFGAEKATAAEPVVLKLVGFKDKVSLFRDETVGLLVDKVEKRSKGQLIINFAGGPETMKPFDMGMGVKRGVFHMASLPASFYIPLVPGAELLIASEHTPKEEREAGVYDFLSDMHKKAGLFYLGRASAINEPEFLLSSTKLVKKPEDMAGLRIAAMAPGPAPAITALGSVFSVVPLPQQYMSIQKGVIDGIATTRKTYVSMSLTEVIKNVIDHAFFVGMATTIMNLDTWNNLPKNLQELLMQCQKEAEYEHAAKETAHQSELEKKMKAAGVNFIRFSPSDGESYLETIHAGFWKANIKRNPEIGPKLMNLLRKK